MNIYAVRLHFQTITVKQKFLYSNHNIPFIISSWFNAFFHYNNFFEDEKRFALAFAKGGYQEEKKERERYREEQRLKDEKRIREFCDMMNQFKKIGEVFEEKKVSEEEREKQKLALLNKIKNKNKDIFTGDEINQLPEIKPQKNIEIETKNFEDKNINNENDDKIPELEIVKKNEENSEPEESKGID